MSGLNGQRVCITGGAGFIGSHLAHSLVSGGARVVVLDDLSTGSPANLAPLGDRVNLVRGSVLHPGELDQALAGVRTVFHLAAYVSAAGSVQEPLACHEVNTTGTLRVLEACQRQGVRRIVFASSAAVYGERPELPKREDHPLTPCSVYAQSKAAGEHLLRVWNCCHGLETVSLRFFNVFGPRQSASSAYASVIAAFADALLSGRRPTILGDGLQSRDFVPVANIVQALERAAVWAGPTLDGVFNVGLGTSTTIRELARLMALLAGVPDEPQFGPPRAGDVPHSRSDISAARAKLGYAPTVGVEEGLRAALEWYRAARRA